MTAQHQLITLRNRIGRGEANTKVTGLSGSALSYFLTRLISELQKPWLLILPDRKEAEKLYQDLCFFTGKENHDGFHRRNLGLFPPYDISPLTGLSPHSEVVNRRLQALYTLTSGEKPLIVTCLDALFFKMLPKETFVGSLEYLEEGEELDRESFLRRLQANGYQRSSLVEERGDYSVRGGVVDVFPPLYSFPLRLEFWGDRLESIRQFDPLSQRSQDRVHEMVLLPASEVIMDQKSIRRSRSMGRLPKSPEDGFGFPGQEAWLNHFYAALDSLFEYLPQECLISLFDLHRLEFLYEKQSEKFGEEVEKFRKEAAEKGHPFPVTDGILIPFQEIVEKLGRHQRLDFSELDVLEKDESGDVMRMTGDFRLETDLEVTLSSKGRVSMAPLAEKISHWRASNGRVVLVSRTEQQANRLKEILGNYDVAVDHTAPCWTEIPKGPGISICLGRLPRGFVWPDAGLYVISEDEIFGPKRGRAGQKRKASQNALTRSSFGQLKVGDLVVHEEHGIGRYGGLFKMEIARKINDFVLIEYARGDKLYVPADRISILQKYLGAEEGIVKIDQLGGRAWNVAKEKAKKSVRKIAKQLVELYALRRYRKGYAYSPPDHYYREFEATFEHEETPDQIKAIEEVLEDMASERPMDRLICGDVGFGKTEIAVRAAFKAVSDGKQVALLVPTTVLAEQHFETLKKRMAPYGVEVDILSRFKSRAEQANTLAKVRSGKIDILVGTHRILQRDVEFRDLGLLMVDEEQRFGVKQKEALKRYRSLVDVLALTATPIPRTFQMSLLGVRDLSIIESAPEDRLAIQTHLSAYDESMITRAVELELDRRGQVFFVHNRVQSIEQAAEQLSRLVPRARIAVAHGQMNERELEKTMMRFLKRDLDVLVCTTIIESGLDIPSANTIIISDVDRLGLAQIYQLRGRVGRAKEKAYAYLLLSNGSVLTREAEKRLKALMDFSHLGAGLHLAMHDLKIRGGGNILGFAQSGHISAVGYELYLRLMEQEIADLKGEEWHEDVNPEIHADIPAFLPAEYVMDADVRLHLYRRLSSLRDKSELEEMKEEILDRFGSPPHEVENLFGLMGIRLLLKRMRVSRLEAGSRSFTLTFSQDGERDPVKLVKFLTSRCHRFDFLSQNRLRVRLDSLSLPEDLPKLEGAIESLDLH